MVALVLGVLGGFARLGGQGTISSLLDLKRKVLKPLIRTLWEALSVKTRNKIICDNQDWLGWPLSSLR